MNPKKPRNTRNFLLPLAVAAACLATAAPARSYDPSDPGSPPPDDPSARRDTPAPARVARELQRRGSASAGDPSLQDADDPGSHRRDRSMGDEGEAKQRRRTPRGDDSARTGDSPGRRQRSGRAFASVPPSFGSEPYPFGYDEIAPGEQTQVAPRAPTLATSLGSEPFPAGSAGVPAADVEQVGHPTGPATLATSLGSEPFILEPGTSAEAAHPRAEPRTRDELARTRR